MDDLIQISKINDFIFCPHSVYLHSVYDNFSSQTHHSHFQTRGKISHENIEGSKYSTSRNWIQGISIYSQKYKLVGKIDLFNQKTGELVERKYRLNKIYDGLRYQLYAQMFCLEEMGYSVKSLRIHSLVDNNSYRIKMPTNAGIADFTAVLDKIRDYKPTSNFTQNVSKCQKCVYSPLCTIYNP